MRITIALLIAVLICGCQHQAHPVSKSNQAPVRLLEGMGNVHHPVSTSDPEAQRYFDQGLALIYAFNHDEAVRSFRKAHQLDPNLAMAYWGEALAIGPNYNLPEIDREAIKQAVTAVQRAQQLAARATPAEQAYISAVSKRYSEDAKADLQQLARDYKSAMGDFARRYPDDLDAATLYAESAMNLRPWKLWTSDGKPEEGTEEIVAVLEGVLKRNPQHTGANHYYIHAVEASLEPQRALICAGRLGELAPAAGHLAHMPAHVYIRTGDYPAAIRVNQKAVAADDSYISCCGPKGIYPTMYYNHNIHFIAVVGGMSGQKNLSLEAANRMAANIQPVAAQLAMVEPYCSIPLAMMVRFGMWNEILNQPEPSQSMKVTRMFWHFARGMAFVARNDIAHATAEAQQLHAAAIESLTVPIGNNTSGGVMAVAEEVLAAKIAQAQGKGSERIEHLKNAVTAQDQLVYDEPPAWPWPVRESLGAAWLMAGDAAKAEEVFREDLRRTPKNPRSQFGLAMSLRAQGKTAEADEVQRMFHDGWKSADVVLALDRL